MTAIESEAWTESWDDEALGESWDDESWDDESEFLGSLLGGPASVIGNAIGGLLGRPAPKPPLPSISVSTPGRGVSTATLNTPAGNATLRLPEPVVTRQEFEASIRKLQDGINRDAARVNTLSKDLDTLRTRVGAVVTDTQKDIAKLRSDAAKERIAVRRQVAKLRADQGQQQMLSMMMSMMSAKSAREEFSTHKHSATGETPVGGATDSSNDMLMMLPLLMMGGGSSGSSSDMMLPLVMMIAMDK